MNKLIYLDNAATTYPKPEIVYTTMDKVLREECVNAGRGSYKLARKANTLIEDTRKLLLELINSKAKNEKVIFTPSATIAINQVLRGIEWEKINNVYVSPFEHNAIMRTLHSLSKLNDFNIHIIPFDNLTFELKDADLKVMFAKNTPDMIVLSHISNVTGYILPIKQCHDLAEKYNPINIVDCAQSLGIVPVDITEELSMCDFIIFAGHKSLYGPLGVAGFICLNSNINLKEIITGGTGSDSTNLEMPQDGEKRYEVGSYNIYAIAGLNAALRWINNTDIKEIFKHEKRLSEILVQELKSINGIEVYVPSNLANHIGVVAFNIEGYKASEVGTILDDEFNVCVRTGHHCAPYVAAFLEGMAKYGTIRASIGYFTNENDIRIFIDSVSEL
ncbi:aminotransferase class V-fold PLP-dependent enzyme [Clostridium chromiireducens]|uniref:Cysteine desulfurase SufS n=1 Tax=Clostridium chromiireducens TaxID=225345 RepID=A0A1V4I806_9CLOT|nr:aminotransferase class V-fold PLP-dependent enzyme [Clostridium chromiireducens]OPJ56118.1 cysteine desulfurase SufS [Clostridium chromiireducens]